MIKDDTVSSEEGLSNIIEKNKNMPTKWFKINDPKYKEAFFDAGTIGLHLASCIVVGLIIGYLLDRWLVTGAKLTMTMLFLGIVAGFKHVYGETQKLKRRQKKQCIAQNYKKPNKYNVTP
ncbi:ATP synthase protein I [Desulfovibrionales bacterium]